MTFADWLALREPADAAARSRELVERLPAGDSHVVHDLGCGTGSMGRWLSPLLGGEQRWVLYDRDPELLKLAAADHAAETRQSDITRLRPGDLTGATLITASALLDMLTADELDRLVTVCAAAGCPTLITLTVVGRVGLMPADPLDQRVATAFNHHQRRDGHLGPDAADVAAQQFRRLGSEVLVRSSAWELGPAEAELASEWFKGWVDAAGEQDRDLAAELDSYTRARLEQAKAGRLAVTVDHADLLALPSSGR